jgi:sodium/potassium/calcium exchanger 2
LTSTVGIKTGLLVMGLFACGIYTQYNGENISSDIIQPVVEVEEEELQGGLRRNLLKKIYPTGHDDDKTVWSKDNKDGVYTCKSEDQPEICRGYGVDACKKLGSDEIWYGMIFVIIGLLYLFIGIAIICDELFVPALEIIAENLNLSNDVAGATLMAAGGSAPELATSFVGTFKRSDVGFGTIVGSAVFNVLFVIGMCAMATPLKFAPLKLTWWPLARDCTYYVLTLITLVIFMSDGKIELYEAFIQFAMYLGYVFLMSKTEKLEKYVKSKLLKIERVEPENVLDKGASIAESSGSKLDSNADFARPSTFRAGILQLLTSKTNIMETAGVACVARIKGDVNEVFAELDKNNNGQIDPDELRLLLIKLGTDEKDVTEEAIIKMVKEIDGENSGVVSKDKFTSWYMSSEQRIRAQTKALFDRFDMNNSGTIDRSEIGSLLRGLGNICSDEDIIKALKELGDGVEVNFAQFESWYLNSLFWTKQQEAADQAAEHIKSLWEGTMDGFADLKDPEVPIRAKIAFIITLPLTLFFCIIPDCRPPGKEKWCYFTFIGSILMVGLLAINMVELAVIFGDTAGIPSVVMGLTVLAAGTSVPDLLSSVIVAQQGQGDMAVSSSIGSNIFDVAFGLPVPWLVFSAVTMASNCNCGVIVESDGLALSLIVLLIMVFAIVVTIWFFNWEMTRALGWSMFFMYFAYVAFALGITDESAWEVPKCSAPFKFAPI